METAIRKPGADDEPDLRQIWKTVFGGADEDAFFSCLYVPDLSAAAFHGSSMVAAGYLFPAGNIVCGGASADCAAPVPCAMIYAVATLPAFRGQGYGTAVVNDLISSGHAAGYPAIVLCPANSGLFTYYSDHTGFVDWFYVNEYKIKKTAPSTGRLRLTEIPADEYARLREGLLAGVPHIEMDPRLLNYQNLLCSLYGGGLYRADSGDGGVSCAVAELESDGVLCIKELLGPKGNAPDVVSSLSELFTADECIVRTPAESADTEGDAPFRRFGMLAAPQGLAIGGPVKYAQPWYGLAFD